MIRRENNLQINQLFQPLLLSKCHIPYTLSLCISCPPEPPSSPVHPLHPSLCSDTGSPLGRRPGIPQSLQHIGAEALGWSASPWCSDPCRESTPGRPAASRCLQWGEEKSPFTNMLHAKKKGNYSGSNRFSREWSFFVFFSNFE